MINTTAFQTCMDGYVGFRGSLDTTMPTLESDLLASSSGLYVNDQHALITVENIYNCIVNTGLITLPTAWSNSTNYTTGQQVTVSGIVYKALANNTNVAVTVTATWERLGNPISIYLTEKLKQAQANLAQKVFQQKNLNQSAKSILPDVMLYDNNANIRKTIPTQNRFVGFKLTLTEGDLGAIIRKLGMMFNSAQTDLNIYLYNSSIQDAVKIWTVTTTKQFTFEWITLAEQTMSFLSDTTNAASEFYIGYYEEDLAGSMAINNEYSFLKNFCGPCNPLNANLRNKWSKYLRVEPFYVTSTNLPGDRTMWNSDFTEITDNINFGLNLLVSVFCDVTDYFCRNKAGLGNAIALQCAVSIIEDMAFSARDNQQSQKLANMATFALGNQQNNTPGLMDKLNQAIMQVDFNYSGTNSDCLPCSDLYNNSVKMKTVY